MRKVLGLAVGAAMMAAAPVQAGCDLDDLVGYTLVAKKTVSGYIDKDEQDLDSDFEGCDFDRIIVFSDDTAVVCQSYSYSYSFMPKAYLFANKSSWKMCVNGNIYRVQPY